ncbi:UNVERIFIED_CONTAM: hypothetical protein NY603_39965, partial [Bacteroidetes bacterium 56_B9]
KHISTPTTFSECFRDCARKPWLETFTSARNKQAAHLHLGDLREILHKSNINTTTGWQCATTATWNTLAVMGT